MRQQRFGIMWIRTFTSVGCVSPLPRKHISCRTGTKCPRRFHRHRRRRTVFPKPCVGGSIPPGGTNKPCSASDCSLLSQGGRKPLRTRLLLLRGCLPRCADLLLSCLACGGDFLRGCLPRSGDLLLRCSLRRGGRLCG